MRRLVLLIAMVVALTLGVAAPAAAAVSDARIVSITPGFRQELVTVESLTYDPATKVAVLTLTVHCFVARYQWDENEYSPWMVSEIEFGNPEAYVTQRGKTPAEPVYSEVTQAGLCEAATAHGIVGYDHTATFTITGLEPGYVELKTSVHTGVFSGHVTTTTLIRAVLPAR